MLSRFQVSGNWRARAALPGAGIPIVFRLQMRRRCAWRDLIWMGVLLLCHQALALGLQSLITPLQEYSADSPRFLLRWLSMTAIAGPMLYLPCAAMLGAMAVPPVSRFEETQSMLLTRLTPFDLCAGRLIAWLWPVISGLLASCALWLAVQLIWRPLLPGSAAGYGAILMMHLVLISSAAAIGSIGFLLGMRHRPGRVWARGAGVALMAAILAVGGLFLVNPLVRRMDNPTALIDSMLLVNPATAATTALQMDVLRLPWLYERTDAPEYPFAYPPPAASCALFACCAGVALTLASVRHRRAYR